MDADLREWQEFFDKEFPEGARVYVVDDVIENLPYTDPIYVPFISVLDLDDGKPVIQFWQHGGSETRDFIFPLDEPATRPHTGGLQYRTSNSRFIVLDTVIPEFLRKDLREAHDRQRKAHT